MRRTRQSALPGAVEEVLKGIEHWRRTREKRTAMPEPLWAAATAAARKHGVYQVARVLRVDYDTLKRRAKMRAKKRREGTSARARFVELRPVSPPIAPLPPTGAVVELSDNAGSKLTVRLPLGSTVDIAGLASALWSRRA